MQTETWTVEQYAEYLRTGTTPKTKASPTPSPTDHESDIPNALDPKAQALQVAKRFRVRVTSCGRRLADTDGNVVKAVLDGITEAGIWPDDSSKFIEEICFTQKAGQEQETIIEVYEILE